MGLKLILSRFVGPIVLFAIEPDTKI